MPRVKKTYPEPSRQKGQRSLDPIFLNRYLPQWNKPDWLSGNQWRQIVELQPTALVCRDTLISNIANLDWKIEPVDSNQRDELKPDIEYYTNFIENSGELDYVGLVEWIGKDALDLPFGGAVEVIRAYDAPDGKVLWLVPLDGATCFPTENYNFPVGQTNGTDNIYFPTYAIDRIYMSPRSNWMRYGWGVAPPEKIYMAMNMLGRGDVYYSNLLIDTPQVGILDLKDMAQDSAAEWVEAWKNMLGGIDPFKIPVLYEHTQAAEFISFTRSPTELMFDKALMKYVILTCAGYGMSTSDIGMPSSSSGGDTLAGSIRQERRTRRTGQAVLKKKFVSFWNKILPDTLQFHFIDLDDEVALGVARTRLANASAMEILLRNQVIVPNEARQQLLADGLFTISMQESIDGGDNPVEPQMPFGGGKINGSGQLGKPIAPSQGGYGEKKSVIERSELLDEETQEILNVSEDVSNMVELNNINHSEEKENG